MKKKIDAKKLKMAESISIDDLLQEIQKIKFEADVLNLKQQCRRAPVSPNVYRKQRWNESNPCLWPVDYESPKSVVATHDESFFNRSSDKKRVAQSRFSPNKKNQTNHSPYSPIAFTR